MQWPKAPPLIIFHLFFSLFCYIHIFFRIPSTSHCAEANWNSCAVQLFKPRADNHPVIWTSSFFTHLFIPPNFPLRRISGSTKLPTFLLWLKFTLRRTLGSTVLAKLSWVETWFEHNACLVRLSFYSSPLHTSTNPVLL